jgi:hypothetical protein
MKTHLVKENGKKKYNSRLDNEKKKEKERIFLEK